MVGGTENKCYINNTACNALLFVDDQVIIAESEDNLQKAKYK
jgi:hypothetical protein